MKKILIIEDTDFISDNISTTLQFEGFETAVAEDGVQGLEQLDSFKPDLVLCDVSMPRLDGFGVLREIRQVRGDSTLPFVFLTAKSEKNDMRRGMELGADDYLTKPFTTTELLGAIHTQLSRNENVRKNYEEQIEQLRGNISYALPHEFRTALNGILGYSDIIMKLTEKGVIDPDIAEIHDMAKDIKASGKRLHILTENFLVYTQLHAIHGSSEKMAELRVNRLESPNTLLKDVAEMLAIKYDRLEDLKLDVTTDSTVIIASESFQKAITELIDNAFKFSKPSESVLVRSALIEEYYHIDIVDEGIGMTDEQLENIGAYNQFNRREFEQQGAGLGLAIARLIPAVHGGSFNISSSQSSGTTVSIELLCAPEQP